MDFFQFYINHNLKGLHFYINYLKTFKGCFFSTFKQYKIFMNTFLIQNLGI